MNDELKFLYISKYAKNNKISFGLRFFLTWIVVTIIYNKLYFQFLESSDIPTLGGHIAGFFGLFVPIGLLSTLVSIFLPHYLIATIVSLVLILITCFIGRKIKMFVITEILAALVILFFITLISDSIRFIITPHNSSWSTFINGYVNNPLDPFSNTVGSYNKSQF